MRCDLIRGAIKHSEGILIGDKSRIDGDKIARFVNRKVIAMPEWVIYRVGFEDTGNMQRQVVRRCNLIGVYEGHTHSKERADRYVQASSGFRCDGKFDDVAVAV